MEPVVVIVICGLAAGWAVWKTGSAIRVLRERRRQADIQAGIGGGGYEGSASIGNFVGGTTSGDGSHSHGSHHGGDCGGHGHGGDGGGHGGH